MTPRPLPYLLALLAVGTPVLWAHALPVLARAQPIANNTTLAGQVELARVVDLAAQRLQLNIEYDAAALRGTVTLRLGAGVNDEELWSLTNRLLASRGFTTVRAPGDSAFSVVRVQDAVGLAQLQHSPLPEGELPAGFQSVVVRVQHKPVKDVVDAVGRVMSKPGGAAVAVGDGGLLMLSDLTPRLEQSLEVVRMIDVPGTPIVVEEQPVRHLGAQVLASLATQLSAKRTAASGAATLGEVLPSPGGGSILVIAPESTISYWRDLISSLDRREPLETHWYAPRHFPARDVSQLLDDAVPRSAADDQWRLVVDELTGTLIITATQSQHEAVRSLIDRLDAAPQAARRPVRAFVIKNRSVNEIIRILEQLVRRGVFAAEPPADSDQLSADVQRGDGSITPDAAPTVANAAQAELHGSSPSASSASGYLQRSGSTNESLALTADEGTNTLIAMGEPHLLAQIESLLETLDVRQPQVMLEVLLLSLSESQALDLGVELEQLLTAGSASIRLSSLFGLSARGAAGTRVVGDGAGFTGIVLSPGDFAIVLRALQNVNKGRSLSMPRLLIANNQSAVLNSVLQQPFATINASATVATTSFGGTQDAGTTVTIRPQIAQGDHLILEYSVALSSFVGSAPAAGLPPPRQQNQVQSIATIPDGYTVVVGGIELENHAQAIAQIPLLGSIPLLGEAFKSRAHSQNRSRFYVFIRANVLRGRGFEDLKYVSDSSIVATDGMIDDGWPAVEPRIIH